MRRRPSAAAAAVAASLFAPLFLLSMPRTAASTESQTITKILDSLVNKSRYDKRLRPNYNGAPVEVGITIHVSSISAVSEVEMDFTLDFYLRQMWTDPRLAYGKEFNYMDPLTVGLDYVNSIWVPDTFFPNEKKSFFHTATTHNSFLRIENEGQILTSQRLTVTATCRMDLHLFPLDSQKCTLEIESYGYSTDDITLWWKDGAESLKLDGNIELPQFKIADNKIYMKTIHLSTGSYARLNCLFLFTRSIGFYLIQIYLPSILIVIISWVSFWLSREATPARVALGVTTVLTMTTLMSTTNSQMPKVSYVKSIDIYLGTCFLMVFASLLEYAAVGYLTKQAKTRRDRRGGFSMLPRPNASATIATVQLRSGSNHGSPAQVRRRTSGAAGVRFVDPRGYSQLYSPALSPMMPGSSKQDDTDEADCECEPVVATMAPLVLPQPTRRRSAVSFAAVGASSIDKYSRVIFPLAITDGQSTHGYSTLDIAYVWGAKKKPVTKDEISLPQFEIDNHSIANRTVSLSTGDYSRLKLIFVFARSSGFYMMNIFLPSILIVIISWVSFWLNRDAAPARVALGVTTVLTMTTLMSTTNASLPKVSYVKAIDYFLGFCFIMVFASLLEYALVGYLSKKVKMLREKRRKKKSESIPVPHVEYPMFDSKAALAHNDANQNLPAAFSSGSASSALRFRGYSPSPPRSTNIYSGHPASSLEPVRTMHPHPGGGLVPLSHPQLHLECDCDLRATTKTPLRLPRARKLHCGMLTPSRIDKNSRWIFPALFIIFNAIYWIFCLLLRESDLTRMRMDAA